MSYAWSDFLTNIGGRRKTAICGSRVTSWELLPLYCFRWTCWALVMSVLFRMARSGATPTEQNSACHLPKNAFECYWIYSDDRSKSSSSAATAVLAMPARRDNRVPKFGRDLDFTASCSPLQSRVVEDFFDTWQCLIADLLSTRCCLGR